MVRSGLGRFSSVAGRWAFVAALISASPAFAPDQAAILGFEDVALWQATSGALGPSTMHSEGRGALAWTGHGYTEITSALLSTSAGIGNGMGSTASYRVRLPSTTPDPSWRGDTSLFLTSPSRGVHHQFVGQRSLSDVTLGEFGTVTFAIPAWLQQALNGAVNDLRVHVVLNTPNRDATYLLDDLRLGLASTPQVDDVALARRVMSFESAADWMTAGPATLGESNVASAGSAALAITTTGGWIPVTSRPVASAPGLREILSLDIMLPEAQPNPSWLGAVQLYVESPSLGIYNQFLSQVELTGVQTGSYTTISFVMSREIVEKLRGHFDDLRYTVVLNVPSGILRTYVIDELRYSTLPGATIPGSRTPGLAPIDLAGVDPLTGTFIVTTTRDGVPGEPIEVSIPEMVGSQATALADLDGNGTMDLVFVNPRTRAMAWLPRLDALVPAYDIARVGIIDGAIPFGEPGQVACADIDGDRDVDCVTSVTAVDPDGPLVSTAYAYINQGGAASFSRTALNLGFPAGVELTGKALADFDGDRRADLAVLAAGPTPDGNQIFVFPSAGDSGSSPFSASRTVAVASTNLLTTLSQPLWGAGRGRC